VLCEATDKIVGHARIENWPWTARAGENVNEEAIAHTLSIGMRPPNVARIRNPRFLGRQAASE
jgi:hypothetical protein